jgi:hypothetical protein
MPLEESFISQLNDKAIGGKIYVQMRVLFHLATSISPVFALLPIQFGSGNMGRDQMIAVSFHSQHKRLFLTTIFQVSVGLGNQRPEGLAKVERALWKGMLSIVTGARAIDVLSKFIDDFRNIEREIPETEKELDWFSRSSTFKPNSRAL